MNCLLLPLYIAILFGQDVPPRAPIAIVGTQPQGYLLKPVVAPGELVTLIVRGVTLQRFQVAPGEPAPTEVQEIQVRFTEPQWMEGSQALPIVAIGNSGCGNGNWYICDFAAISVQMATNFFPTPRADRTGPAPVFTLHQNGVAGLSAEFRLVKTNVQMLTACHTAVQDASLGCQPFLYDEDGYVALSEAANSVQICVAMD